MLKLFVNRFLLTGLSLLILTTGSGLMITKHFCGGSLKSISLIPSNESCCGGSEKFACCNNTSQLVKVDVNLQITPSITFDFSSVTSFLTQIFTQSIDSNCIFTSVFVYLPQKIPPLLYKDIYILIQLFLL